MRVTRALAIGVGVAALTATAGCGGKDTADSGLPEAKDVASVAKYVSAYTTCEAVQSGDAYDTNRTGENYSWGAGGEVDAPSWGIKERAVCKDASGDAITLLITPDMRKFQSAVKKNHEKLLVGQDFAVVPTGNDAIRGLTTSDLRLLTCDPDFSVPSGYTKKAALVDGCVLTDYLPG
ncbi:hypothetical protein ABZ865_16675 [Streptomyces sp. NPDC047085]|uniref:hypothetical protein n=1 Tax=Streptomyces sp. NPDC047085 TaxID=3155140 RepID=UPI0034002B63